MGLDEVRLGVRQVPTLPEDKGILYFLLLIRKVGSREAHVPETRSTLEEVIQKDFDTELYRSSANICWRGNINENCFSFTFKGQWERARSQPDTQRT